MNRLLTKLIYILCISFFATNVAAQTTGLYYNYASFSYGTWTSNAGAAVIAANSDDVLTSFTPPAGIGAGQWNGFFLGSTYFPAGQPIYVSSNGFMSFLNPGTSIPTNSLATNPYGIIAPIWDDLKVGPAGNVNWKIVGGSPSRRLIVEWNSMLWDKSAGVVSQSVQVTIYEKTHTTLANVIEFKYFNHGFTGTTNIVNASGGASIGLSGFCAGDYYSWNSVPGAAAPIKTSESTSLGSHPSLSFYYRLTPAGHPADNCASAQALVFNPALPLINSLGTTLNSTLSAASAACWGASITTPADVWFTFTKPDGITNFEIFTDILDCRGANYRTGIEIYTSPCGGGAIACDFGSAGPAGTNATSYLNMTGLPCVATTYYARVASDSAYRAYFRFNIRPPGRDCNYATQVCGIPYASPLSLSTCGFGNDYDSTNSACHTPRQEGEDYLFVYTPAANECVNISLNNTPANSYPGLTVYQGCPITGNCLANVQGPGVSAVTFSNMSLVAGITYYFAVDYDANGGFVSCMNSFDLTITNSPSPTPSYDLCAVPAGPVPVTVGANCTGLVDYNNNCASPSATGSVPQPGCGSFIEGVTPDVWLTFTSTSTQPHQIDVAPGIAPAAQDLAMAVYTSSGGSCGPFTLVNCDDNSNSGMPSLTVVPPTASTVYYVRIWSNSGTQTGNFRICVLAGCSPANDLPCAAVALTLSQPVSGDNACSSGAGEPGSASCWGVGNTLNTVWYSFVASNTTMKVRTRLFTLYDSQIAVYSGTCGPGLVQIAAACNNDYTYNCGNAFTTKASDLTVTGLTIGATYYVSVDGRGSNTGTFEIIVIDGAATYPPVAVQDCALPVNICSSSTFTVADPGYSGAGNFCDAGGPSICMFAGESSSAWYTFSITGPATLQWVLTTSISNDYDWMIWCVDTMWNNNPNHSFPTVPNYCSVLNSPNLFPWTSCNVSHIDNTGMSTVMGTDTVGGTLNQHRNVGGGSTPPLSQAGYIPAGMTATFLLSLNNWSNTTVGFNFNFNGTPVNGNPPSMTWQNATTNVWSTRANWVPSSCGNVPDCINQIAATIASGGIQPVVSASATVKDITINAGASLTIQPGVILSVCGNFINNGTLNCQPGSTVRFIGNSNTVIGGTFGPVLNNFYHLEFAKSAGATVTLNTNIYAQGNDSIYGGILNNNNKNTEVGGNFYNYNGATSYTGLGAGVGGSTLTFTRRSGVNQNFRNDGNNLTLNNVTMNQVVAGALGLFNNATSNLVTGVSGVLTLTQGRIITGPREVSVTNSASAACTPGNTTSYVEGDLRRAIATAANSYDFPVGDGTSALAPGIVGYQRANITFTAAPTGAYNLLAHFYRWTLGGVAFPGNGPASSECVTATYNALPTFDQGYWRINASIGAPTGTYGVTLYNLNMSNNTGSGWTAVKAVSGTGAFALSGACFIASTAAQTRRDVLTGFSDFATVQSQNPLPIQLLYFNATPKGRDVLSTWTTSSEINNDHFELERSSDGFEFVKIGRLEGFGPGVSTEPLHYKYNDRDVCDALIYYRLKQVDIDGHFSYSKVVAVNCNDAANSIDVYPNPANTLLNVNFSAMTDCETQVEIMNMVGMIMMKKAVNAQNGFNSASLDIENLPSGVYYLIIKDIDRTDAGRQVKFLKY
jgi:hypothetical protein